MTLQKDRKKAILEDDITLPYWTYYLVDFDTSLEMVSRQRRVMFWRSVWAEAVFHFNFKTPFVV